MPRDSKNGAVRPDKDNAYGGKAYRQTDSDCHHDSGTTTAEAGMVERSVLNRF